jgi:hypothetical protein
MVDVKNEYNILLRKSGGRVYMADQDQDHGKIILK